MPNTKKKIGLFGRIKGFFSKRRQAKAERLERAQTEERAKQAQLAEEAGRQYDREQNPDQAMKEAIVDFLNNENEYLSSPKQDDGDFNNEKVA